MNDLKEKIANLLMEECETKTLDKITVNDLTKKLNVTRQAFYYHFADIYSVIEWIYETAAKQILQEYSDIKSWTFGFYSIMFWVNKHKNFVLNTFKSIPRDYVENFMNSILTPYVKQVVEDEAKNIDINEEQKKFITKFYTLSFNAIMIDWISHGLKGDIKETINNIDTLIYGDIHKAIKNFTNK